MVWDGAQTHKAVAVRELVDSYGWKLERLPPYSPDLNPVEGWWFWMKGGPLANFAGETLKDVGREVRVGARRVQRRPNLISAFLAKAGLSL